MGLDKEDIMALIAILQKGLTDDEPNKKSPTKSKSKPKETNKSKFRNKKAGSDNGVNKFISMPEMNMHKEDVAFDKAVRRLPPVPRNREFQPIDVVCRSCGKKEKINPVLVHDSVDRYKCNKCSVNAG
jgi:hypothetical protein